MGKLVKVASTNELTSGEGKVIDAENEQIALFNIEGTYHAIDNICQHAGGPLGEGSTEGNVVTCPWHAWEYDVTSGACLTNPNVQQRSYPVTVEGNDIFIEL